VKQRLLALLRVPERPDPPPGAGEDVETFRPTKGFFYYSVLLWLPKQIAALWGLLFSLALFGGISGTGTRFLQSTKWQEISQKLADQIDGNMGLLFFRLDIFQIINFFESLAVVLFVAQLLFTGLLLKLSWELRWYMVGERSLRIRHGLWSVREQTMTIANIQNMTVRQGPLQRLFGFSDLEISTAGGGGQNSSGEDGTQQKDSFHIGRFRGVADAAGLRDKLRRRLTAVQETDLAGSPPAQSTATDSDVSGRLAASSPSAGVEGPALGGSDLARAAEALLAEARALRREASPQG